MTIHRGDLLEHMRGNEWLVQNGYIPKAHAVLCDPPYFLGGMSKRWSAATKDNYHASPFNRTHKGFMGQSWDGFSNMYEYQAWCTEWGRLLLSFVYPGAVMLAFGGTRTYHRLAAGLEDAGWIVGDSLIWTYSSGFPKSHSISKAIDKAAFVPCPECLGDGGLVVAGDRGISDYKRVPCEVCDGTGRKKGAEREVVGEWHPTGTARIKKTIGAQVSSAHDGYDQSEIRTSLPITAPATDAAIQWDGWGTALAPAYEPILLARAPWSGTYAGLAQEHGTGALAIDNARIPANGDAPKGWETPRGGIWATDKDAKANLIENPNGRWPKNLLLSCACESDEHDAGCPVRIMGEQTSERTSKATGGGDMPSSTAIWGNVDNRIHRDNPPDTGGTAARMFYQAKSARWERESGLHKRALQTVNDGRDTPIDNPYQRGETQRLNVHPTCKPIKLDEYLAKLLLPPELDTPRILLNPFTGSGSEMIGATLAGWDKVIGFEQSDEYADIAEARIAWWAQFADYEQAKRAWDADNVETQQRTAELAAGVQQLSMFGGDA